MVNQPQYPYWLLLLIKIENYNSCRTLAAQLASTIFEGLHPMIGSQIGRFDDSFNPNCVGDAFQSAGVPTLLVEAGHYPEDYEREKTREYVFYAYVLALKAIATSSFSDVSVYHSIPENQKALFRFSSSRCKLSRER